MRCFERMHKDTKAPGIRIRKFTQRLILAGLIAGILHAQSPGAQITSAAALNIQGKFRETIALLSPLLESNEKSDDAGIGIAWNVQGVALQNMGYLDRARRSYETSIGILRKRSDQTGEYASALENLGSLMAEEGQLTESRALRTRARQLYQAIADHAGVARVDVTLALVALAERDRKRAGKMIADARREEGLGSVTDDGDLAEISMAQANLQLENGDWRAALDSVNSAIQLWSAYYGDRYYLLADGYALRGQVEAKLRDRDLSLADFRHSLELLQRANFENSRAYFLIESAYAKVLRDSGERADAKRIESEAQAGLEELRMESCNACSISAAAFQ